MGFAKFGKSFVVLSESRDARLLYSQGRMPEHETISPELSSVVQAKSSSYIAFSQQ